MIMATSKTQKPLWLRLDLEKHAVIEASAGTGKTYTIEHLVVRLLAERPEISIDQLLIVTYTEKAAGELKDRVRSMLQECVDRGNLEGDKLEEDEVTRLRQALDAFDTAHISTIHGFCQQVLQEYAFENGQVFDLELVDDGVVYGQQLREIMRRDWPNYAGRHLSDVIVLQGEKSSLESKSNNLAAATQVYRDSIDKLVPSGTDFAELIETFAGLEEAVCKLRLVLSDDFISRYEGAGLLKKELKDRTKILEKLKSLPPKLSLQESLKIAHSVTKLKIVKDNPDFSFLKTGLKQNAAPLKKTCPDLDEVAYSAVAFVEQVEICTKQINAFFPNTLLQLKENARAYKSSHGLLSYNDMLVRLRDALDPTSNPTADSLLATLRGNFRVALVDEFQDTDPVQWEIFRRIFVDDAPKKQTIFVVGDPKQAIYSFRGADIQTYLGAVKQIGKTHQLDMNFRSSPEMMDVFNRLFGQESWFGTSGGTAGIAYAKVEPSENNPKIGVYADTTNRATLNLVDLGPEPLNVGPARHALGRFIRDEIATLLKEPSCFQHHDSSTGQPRELRADDICVLVEKRATAKLLTNLFRKAGIPCTIYNQPGLYQSEEARHLAHLLAWMARPDDEALLKKALLTRFFALEQSELLTHSLLADRLVQRFSTRWEEQCQKRQWARLFESFAYDTGLFFREAKQDDGERRMANFEQLFQELTQAANSQNLDAVGLQALLDQQRHKSVSLEQDSDLYRQESEKPMVQIMTMHAAKGLEFPIVFIGDGFAGKRNGQYVTCHDEDKKRIVELKVGKTFSHGEDAEQERLAEKRRLLYVALTRARYKLYLPCNWVKAGKITAIGAFIQPTLETAGLVGDKTESSENAASPASKLHVATLSASVSNADVRVVQPVFRKYPVGWRKHKTGDMASKVADVVPPLGRVPSLYGCSRAMDSFSGLVHGPATPSEVPTQYGESTSAHQDDEGNETEELKTETVVTPAAELEAGNSTASLLPMGKKVGNLFHALMEALADPASLGFHKLAEYDSAQAALADETSGFGGMVDRLMAHHRIKNREYKSSAGSVASGRLELAQWAWRSVRVRLPDGFCLGSLPPSDCRAELEFYMAEGGDLLCQGHEVPAWRQGLLTGSIDLLFRYKDRYYILDWKTNTLDNYDKTGVGGAMDEHNYYLQYKVYTLALFQWLKQAGVTNPAEKMGGIYYFFVRGLEDSNSLQGVFHHHWVPEDENKWREEVSKTIYSQKAADKKEVEA
jgi:exodeoxyribonuclease V beta subunit